VGMDAEKVAQVQRWFADASGDNKGRLVIVRSGRVVLEYYHRMSAAEKPNIASAAKSIYSNVLGILVAEGGLKSADELVVETYPEMMEVKEGEGNKPGRYAYPVNRGITFRHLICNVSGYMKPGEEPGKVFNYQSWGMNVLTHALAKLYGLYDVSDPEGLPGFRALIEDKLASKIGATWDYAYSNPPFNDRLQRGARLDVFGYYTQVHATALDLARVGWLWCNWGKWEDMQVVPEAWVEASTARHYVFGGDNRPWIGYGYLWWILQPDPQGDGQTDIFAACGAHGQYIFVIPEHAMVVVVTGGTTANDAEDAPVGFLYSHVLSAVER
jgi:CubicO group peptidase (beta-lactamase class C family)